MKKERFRGGDTGIKTLIHKVGNGLFWTLCIILIGGFGFSACDKVEEKPEPDSFSKMEMISIVATSDTNGEAVIDIIQSNNLKEALSISFSEPKNGKLTVESTSSRFRYKADKGFNGIDTFSYTVCKTALCKVGNIRIDVKQPVIPCASSFSSDGSYNDVVEASATMVAKLHPGDFLCKKAVLKMDGCSWALKSMFIDSEGIHFGLPTFPITQDVEVQFSYSVRRDSTSDEWVHRVCSTMVRVNSSYCDKLFNVKDFLSKDQVARRKPYRFDRAVAAGLVSSCLNDLDTSYLSVYAFQGEAKIQESLTRPGLYLIYAPDSLSTAVFYYKLRNKNGVLDTGKGTVRYID